MPGTEAQALAMAAAIGVPDEYASTVWHDMEGIGWEDSSGRPITNFASYLKARYNHRTDKHAREEKRFAPRTNGHAPNGSAKPQTETVWQIKQAIAALDEEIQEVESRQTGAWGELSRADKAKRAELMQRRRELRGKLAGSTET